MATGLRKGLTSYGDAGFSLYLRKAFIKAAGYSDDALDRPIVGITDTASDYNPCHGNAPQLIEAISRGVMLAGGLPMRFPDHLHPRILLPPHLHVPPQPDGDGHGGDAPRPADGRGRAGRRLRQDPAGADHGRGERRHPRRGGAGRPHGGRPPPRRGAGRLHRLPPLLGPAPRGRDRRGRDRDDLRPPRALRRHLHGDGHGLHHGLHDRGDGAVAALLGRHPRPACGAPALRRGVGQGGGRARHEPRAAPGRAAHAGLLPQRHGRAPGHRRLHQRADPPDGHRRPPGREARPGGVRPDRARGAGADRPQAFGRPLHGALPPRRRHPAPAGGTRPASGPGRAHRQPAARCATTPRRPRRCRARR